MNKTKFKPRNPERFAAVAILAIAVTVLFGLTALPAWLANARYQQEVEELHGRLVRLDAMSEQADDIRERFDALRRAQNSRGYFLQSESASVASADLQRILKSISNANGTQLMSTQILPASTDDNLTRVSLRVRVRGPLAGLIASMYALETNTVLLFIDNLSIRQAASRRLQNVHRNQPFEANFDLIAFNSEPS